MMKLIKCWYEGCEKDEDDGGGVAVSFEFISILLFIFLWIAFDPKLGSGYNI